MKRIGAQLVQERRLALSEGVLEDDAEKGQEYGKDLLSLLVKANMAGPEASSMSDEDVQDRRSTSRLMLLSVSYSRPRFSSLLQKLPPLSSLVMRRVVRASPGASIAYPITSRCRSVCVTRSTTSAPIHRTRNRSSLSSTWITL